MKMVEYFEVARMTDCPSIPEGKDSDGARWLMRVYEEALDFAENDEPYFLDNAPEIADGLVPIYTNELWNVWVDCGGYNNDNGEYRDFVRSGDTGDMMNRIAQADCYEWAMNVIFAIEREMR